MTVDYRSLFVRVRRRVPNHLTPPHALGPPRIASTGRYDTSSYCSMRSPSRRNTIHVMTRCSSHSKGVHCVPLILHTRRPQIGLEVGGHLRRRQRQFPLATSRSTSTVPVGHRQSSKTLATLFANYRTSSPRPRPTSARAS